MMNPQDMVSGGWNTWVIEERFGFAHIPMVTISCRKDLAETDNEVEKKRRTIF